MNKNNEILYQIKDNSFNDILDGKYTFKELKDHFKCDVLDDDDKELVIDYNNEIDACNNVNELACIIYDYRGLKYDFIKDKESVEIYG